MNYFFLILILLFGNLYAMEPNNWTTKLREATENGSVSKVLNLLKENKNIDPNEPDEKGNSALHIAALKGFSLIVFSLSHYKNIKLNEYNKEGQTPLLLALSKKSEGHKQVANRLLNLEEIDITKSHETLKTTPLHAAAKLGYINIVQALIHKKADINALDAVNDTPLHNACRYGHAECVKILLRNGANITLKNCKNKTAYDVIHPDYKALIKKYFDKYAPAEALIILKQG